MSALLNGFAPIRLSCCSSCSLTGVNIAEPGFASLNTAAVVLADASVLFILAAGLTFVIMLGGIDLSVQAAASFASMVVAELLPRVGYAAFPITILVGLAMGLASGFVHVKLRIPSFVATLATAGIMTGLSLLMEGGRTVSLTDEGREQVALDFRRMAFRRSERDPDCDHRRDRRHAGAALHSLRTL